MIPEKLTSKILLAALLVCVATIPFGNNLNSIAIIVFVASCVIRLPLSEIRKRLSRYDIWVIPVVYFIWTACSYFWDASGGYTVKELERYTILFFVPPALAIVPKIPAKTLKLACMVFTGVTALVCIICLVMSYNEYRVTGDYRVFYYHYLSEQMQLNAIFLSNYCLAGITWLLYYGFVEKEKRSAGNYLFTIFAGLFLFLMIFLLSSKLIIFLTVVIVMIFILVLGYIRGYFLRSLLITILIVAVGFLAVSKLSYLSWRINVTEIKMYGGPEDDQNGMAIRLFMWKTAKDLIAERPLLGYGLKGAREVTLEQYRKTGFDLGVRGFYHSHNQYLESALMAGIPATVLLLTFIVFALRRGIVKGNFLLILMVCHFMIQSIFEATFEVQHEFVFYIFFIFLFYYHAPEIRRTGNP